jgi:hypothetical protein
MRDTMQTARSGQPIAVLSRDSLRAQAGRRVRADRLLAGDPPLRQVATDAGLDYGHLVGVVKGAEPLTSSDVLDLGRVLGVPSAWLARGWGDQTDAGRPRHPTRPAKGTGMTSTTPTTTISIRLTPELLARIQSNAERAGVDRNAYILSWLSYACDTTCVFAGETGTTYKRRVTRGFLPDPNPEHTLVGHNPRWSLAPPDVPPV